MKSICRINMENIFVDVNVFIDIFGAREYGFAEMVDKKTLTVSALSFHVLMYILRLKVPNDEMEMYRENLLIVDLSKEIVKRAMVGPTDDFEDNVQLHSAVAGDCDFFLTLDKKLLKMKYFGKMIISNQIL
jgi:predicted nucleic acid-binding protein